MAGKAKTIDKATAKELMAALLAKTGAASVSLTYAASNVVASANGGNGVDPPPSPPPSGP